MTDLQRLIVRRNGTVVHRATGTVLGEVAQVPHDAGHEAAGEWWIWSVLGPEAVGDPTTTRAEAVVQLLEPRNHLPMVPSFICPRHRNVIRWGPPEAPCPDCDTPERAVARHRAEHPQDWVVHDLLLAETPVPRTPSMETPP